MSQGLSLVSSFSREGRRENIIRSTGSLGSAHRDRGTISVVPAKAGTQAADRGRNEKRPCVYILASKRNGTFYVGVKSDMARRVWQHRSNTVGGFVRDYAVYTLVFVEFHDTMADAILREKRIKKWRRAWKLELIERHNPRWRDLCDDLP
jgi:putative endonuclease